MGVVYSLFLQDQDQNEWKTPAIMDELLKSNQMISDISKSGLYNRTKPHLTANSFPICLCIAFWKLSPITLCARVSIDRSYKTQASPPSSITSLYWLEAGSNESNLSLLSL